MKKLQCEMCGSGEFVKDGDLFVCQSCGMKYTTETAQKMMIEGTVNVEGTVTVDKSADLVKFYEIARRAKEDGNNETAAQYYNMILAQEPTSWEAYFYATYFKALQCKIAGINNAAISIINSLSSTFGLIRDYVTNEEEKAQTIGEVISSSASAANLLLLNERSHYCNIDASIRDRYTSEHMVHCRNIIKIYFLCGDAIEATFEEEMLKKLATHAWKCGVTLCDGNELKKMFDENYIHSYVDKICKYDKEYARKLLQKEYEAAEKKLEQAKLASQSGYAIKSALPVVAIGTVIAIIMGVLFNAMRAGMIGFWLFEGFALLGAITVFIGTKTQAKQLPILEEKVKTLKNKIDSLDE